MSFIFYVGCLLKSRMERGMERQRRRRNGCGGDKSSIRETNNRFAVYIIRM